MITLLIATMLWMPVQVTPPSFSEAREAQVAIGSDHRIYVAYGVGNTTFVSVSQDEGKTYGSPIKVAESGKLSLGMRRGPRIVAHNGIVTVTSTYAMQGGGRDGDILAFKSTDYGKTWSTRVKVNDVEGAAREGLHAMAIAPDGTIACTWLDLRSKGTKIFASISKDGGSSWSENRLVYASPSGSVCECCHPSVAYDQNGKLFIMFRNSLDGARDMYLAGSTDGGRTFASGSKLGLGTWMLNACPMDGGNFVLDGLGQVKAFWRRENNVFLSKASGSETLLSQGRQPWMATGSEGDYLVWSDGSTLLAHTPTEQKSKLSENANDGVVSASLDGKLVISAWTENGIRATRLR